MAKATKHTTKTTKVSISETIGKVSVKWFMCDRPKAIMTLAHGAGAGMTHPFMQSLAEALGQYSIATARFNFPYLENGKKRPDVAAVAEKTVQKIIEAVHEKYPNIPLYVSGKSFGGRMSSQLLSKICPAYVKGIVFFGFPLHAPGNLSRERAEHLYGLTLPMLFLQGTKDTLANAEEMKKVAKKIKKSTLVFFENADHSFKRKKEYLIAELSEQVDRWLSD